MRCQVLIAAILAALLAAGSPNPAPKNLLSYVPPTIASANITLANLASLKQRVRDERRFFDPIRASFFLNRTFSSSSSSSSSSATLSKHHKRSLTVRNTATNASGNVALQDGVSMYYAPGDFQRGAGQQFAKLDVESAEKMTKVLSLEHFDDVTSTAKCEKEGKVELTFDREVQFQQIQAEWEWINQGKDHAVILITENEHCDRNNTDGSPRQLWKAAKADFDDKTNTVHLTAQPINFAEAFGKNWHLNIHRDEPTTPLYKRISSSAHISLNNNFSGYGLTVPSSSLGPTELLSHAPPLGSLTCSNCAITGAIDFSLSLHGLTGTGTLHITGTSLSATLSLLLEIYSTLPSSSTSSSSSSSSTTTTTSLQEHEIWSSVLPYSGIHIPSILDIGPTLKFLLSSTFSSSSSSSSSSSIETKQQQHHQQKQLALQLGYTLTFPEQVNFQWDILHPTSKPTFTGLEPTFELLPAGISDDWEIAGTWGPKVELSLDWNVLGQGASVGVQFCAAEVGWDVRVDRGRSGCGGGGGGGGQGGGGGGGGGENAKLFSEPEPSSSSEVQNRTTNHTKGNSVWEDDENDNNNNKSPTTINLSISLAQKILAHQSLQLWNLHTTQQETLAATTFPLTSTCLAITGGAMTTKLTPTTASSSIESYIPWTGNLEDLATAKLLSGAKDVASAYKVLGESGLAAAAAAATAMWKTGVEGKGTSVLGQVTKGAMGVEHVVTSAVVAVVATAVATKVEGEVGKAMAAVADAGEKVGDASKVFCLGFC
ncbi:hypothetical protein CERZMDRAFT_103151 [Cercospora zeae-maydis SCOH1-5]|uniref:Uncharacterized protein n=1 Tax=Cercospora zeae-maydis SCOH1-5 TaxID=717836 RepID=A0A6A6EZP4_9PEZI|nr:hypothetical protein CERZMDRAFT_103151 [Cercospora zeae-maydis SCOH1-5]